MRGGKGKGFRQGAQVETDIGNCYDADWIKGSVLAKGVAGRRWIWAMYKVQSRH